LRKSSQVEQSLASNQPIGGDAVLAIVFSIVSGEFVAKRLAELAHHVHHGMLCSSDGGVVTVCCESLALVVPKRRYVLPVIPWFDKRVA
jgi:hypothetical protein